MAPKLLDALVVAAHYDPRELHIRSGDPAPEPHNYV